MVCVLDNVAHFVAGAAVLCHPMMNMALNRIDEARAEIVKKLPILRHAQLEGFEHGLRMALINMYAEPDQWIIRALRITVGKLIGACFHIILQSPAWPTKFEKLWGTLRVRVVADHKWLYQAGLCERNPVIMHGFEHMSINWTNYRHEGWQPSDDLMFPEDEVHTLPKPPPVSTPQNKRKTSKAIPIITPGGTIAPRSSTMPRGRGRGRGAPTGLVEPAPQPARGKGKQNKKAPAVEKAAAESTEQAGSSSTSKATPATTSGITTEAGPSSTAARDDPFVSDDANIAYWAEIASKFRPPTPGLDMPPPGGPSSGFPARRSSSPTRPSSSSSALSAMAEPFLPGGSLPSAGSSSTHENTSSFIHGDTRISTEYLESPSRLAELYGTDDDEPAENKDKGKGKEVAHPATPGSSSKQNEDAETIGGPSIQQEATGQTTLDLTSLDINKKNDGDDTRPSDPSSSKSQSDDKS